MLGELYIVVGLPGSGKSTLSEAFEAKGGKTYHDYKNHSKDGTSAFTSSRHYEELIQLLRAGHGCMINDIDFCRKDAQDDAVAALAAVLPNLVIRWHFFANDPKQCVSNVRARNRPSLQDELNAIEHFTKKYFIPGHISSVPVFGRGLP